MAEGAPMKFPNMNEFSPGVLGISIRPLLQRLNPFLGDRLAVEKALSKIGSLAGTKSPKQQSQRCRNVLIGMSQCGLYDLKTETLTELGASIKDASDDKEASSLFAAHILRNLHGQRLVAVIGALRRRGVKLQNSSIRAELKREGFSLTHNESNFGKLRLWLEQAGVVDSKWEFAETRLKSLIGLDSSALAELDALTKGQRAFLDSLRALASLAQAGDWIDTKKVLGRIDDGQARGSIPEGQLRAQVLNPLEKAGWLESDGKGGGRGGKSGRVRPTAKLTELGDEMPLPLESTIPPELRPLLDRPLEQILVDVDSDEGHTAGFALELLALRVLTELGLRPTGFRARAAQTGNAEVDLTANGLNLHYSRWLLQCKRTSEVRSNQLAREVGLAIVMRAHVVLMVTTGKFMPDTVLLADQAARNTHLQVLLVDGEVLQDYRRRGIDAVRESLIRQSENVLSMKAEQDQFTKSS